MDMERPCDITVTYQDGTRVVHRYVTGERVRELENLPFADPKVVSAESTDSEPRPHGEYFDFHRAVDDLIEQVRDAADPGYLKEPLPALGLAAYVRARFADELGGLVRA
ncbi:hypothetical protein, partial [Actinocrinis sp.]|uniref:hypothetical protein n=1 Tax=Actinocrinis sp. TaxID=1920516 RepID=UPI002D666B50